MLSLDALGLCRVFLRCDDCRQNCVDLLFSVCCERECGTCRQQFFYSLLAMKSQHPHPGGKEAPQKQKEEKKQHHPKRGEEMQHQPKGRRTQPQHHPTRWEARLSSLVVLPSFLPFLWCAAHTTSPPFRFSPSFFGCSVAFHPFVGAAVPFVFLFWVVRLLLAERNQSLFVSASTVTTVYDGCSYDLGVAFMTLTVWCGETLNTGRDSFVLSLRSLARPLTYP